MEGRVLSTVGGVYNVLVENTTYQLKPLGIFRHQKIKPVVGDIVEINHIDQTITKILPRRNYLIRPMIANIDYGIIVTSLLEPNYSSQLLDKFITMLLLYGITPLIVLSKIDLVEDKVEPIVQRYQNLGIQIIPYSKKSQEGLDKIKEKIKQKVVAFMGQTGVGKSSLINLIDSNLNRKIGEYSVALGRGKHQTKEVIIIPYSEGLLADTPGFSSLELECFKEDLAQSFVGFEKYTTSCKYADCLHINERECAIKNAVDNNLIDQETYRNYLQILKDLPFRKDRYK